MAMRRPPWVAAGAHLALLLANLAFASWNVLAEALPAGLGNAVILCAIRDGTATAALCAGVMLSWVAKKCEATPASAKKPALPRGRSDVLLLVAVGLAGPFVAPLASVLCVVWSDADVAGILNSLAPAMAGLLAVLAGQDRPTARLVAGVLLGTVGGLLAARGAGTHETPRTDSGSARPVAGALAGLVMALSQAVFLVAMKPLLRPTCDRDAIAAPAVIRCSYLVACGVSLLALVGVVLATGVETAFATWRGGDSLLAIYSGLVCGALSYSLVAWANQVVPATLCALYGALQPPFTALMAFAAKGETLSLEGCLSMGLVGVSLALVSWDHPAHTETGTELAGALRPAPVPADGGEVLRS